MTTYVIQNSEGSCELGSLRRRSARLLPSGPCVVRKRPGLHPAQREGQRITSGPHWYCDAVAVSFKDRTGYPCEITYAARAPTLVGRLRSWDGHWEALKAALTRDLRPWLFVPEAHAERMKSDLVSLRCLPSLANLCHREFGVVPLRYML